MAETIRLIDPDKIDRNPENPRLIFRNEELQALQDSIKAQGILVPLTVFSDGNRFVLLDGERRWRCATKLGLPQVPAIVQPKPDRLTNIMMMFAIHNTRKDWDPLPTAYKLRELEQEFTRRQKRAPNESELAELASIERGEVRRLKKLLGLPEVYHRELMEELEKPRSQQVLTVDVVLEATKGASALRKRSIIDSEEEDQLRRALIEKYRTKVIKNTVAPRQLARIARAVERDEVPVGVATRVTRRLINEPTYTIDDAFKASVEQVDFEHGLEQLVERVLEKIREHEHRGYEPSEAVRASLLELQRAIRQRLGS
jgi:ParB family chromosome partitioning protein